MAQRRFPPLNTPVSAPRAATVTSPVHTVCSQLVTPSSAPRRRRRNVCVPLLCGDRPARLRAGLGGRLVRGRTRVSKSYRRLRGGVLLARHHSLRRRDLPHVAAHPEAMQRTRPELRRRLSSKRQLSCVQNCGTRGAAADATVAATTAEALAAARAAAAAASSRPTAPTPARPTRTCTTPAMASTCTM